MPSEKKRINLTMPEDVYKRLRAYMEANGLYSDATACLQLVCLRLNTEEASP